MIVDKCFGQKGPCYKAAERASRLQGLHGLANAQLCDRYAT
jgi:hypothetical protein